MLWAGGTCCDDISFCLETNIGWNMHGSHQLKDTLEICHQVDASHHTSMFNSSRKPLVHFQLEKQTQRCAVSAADKWQSHISVLAAAEHLLCMNCVTQQQHQTYDVIKQLCNSIAKRPHQTLIRLHAAQFISNQAELHSMSGHNQRGIIQQTPNRYWHKTFIALLTMSSWNEVKRTTQ